MKEFKYVVTDPEGIHARPAGILVKRSRRQDISQLSRSQKARRQQTQRGSLALWDWVLRPGKKLRSP